MKKLFWILMLGLSVAVSARAQNTPLGLWQSIDEKTGEVTGEIRIAEKDGVLHGWIEKSMKKGVTPDTVCEECPDDRKGKPIIGLEIIRGGQRSGDKAVWENSRILDAENGRIYRATFTPIEGGRRMELRGYFGPFWRTQVWRRIGS